MLLLRQPVVIRLAAVTLAALLFASTTNAQVPAPFRIQVVDDVTQRGVPLVELETTAGRVFVTDSAGIVAFMEPGWMNQEVWFTIRSHGYEYPADGFGMRGVRLKTVPGQSATLRIKRLNIAERVCRLSGAGIYRDSVLVGDVPADQALLLRAKITGYDSVQATVYQNRLYWFWGDTNQTGYPLGNFHMTGATTPLPTVKERMGDPYALSVSGRSGSGPYHGLNYDYFTDDRGFARGVCRMAGEGPTWLDGLTVLTDSAGRERMYAAYAKIRPPLSTYRRGICVWNDERNEFEPVREFPVDTVNAPFGHPQICTLDGVDFVLFGDPFPAVRVPATVEDFLDLEQYEGFTPLKPGTRWSDKQLERDPAGKIVYAWKRGTPALSPAEERQAVKDGLLQPHEARWQLRSGTPDQFIEAHRGTVCWNSWRRKWVMIATQLGGSSVLGEVWYAEAQESVGPWGRAIKVVTHDRYSFYNPLQHQQLDSADGRYIHIEGTYTHTFSGNEHRTPDYDYNQILYRLDLADPRLHRDN